MRPAIGARHDSVELIPQMAEANSSDVPHEWMNGRCKLSQRIDRGRASEDGRRLVSLRDNLRQLLFGVTGETVARYAQGQYGGWSREDEHRTCFAPRDPTRGVSSE